VDASTSSAYICHLPLLVGADGLYTGGNNVEGNDYAAIYLDARRYNPQDPSTRKYAEAAVQALRRKLKFTLQFTPPQASDPYPFQTWLAGAPAALVFAAATELNDKAFPFPAELHELLECAAQQYFAIGDTQSDCGSPGNACMDDYTVTAAGFGWAAAYQKRRHGDMAAQPYVERAKTLIRKAFMSLARERGSVCYYAPANPPELVPSCDGSPADSRVRIISSEHTVENPVYGFGLMTSVAGAIAGLERAVPNFRFPWNEPLEPGVPNSLTARAVANALFRHAQEKTLFDGSAFKRGLGGDCLDVSLRPNQCPASMLAIPPLKVNCDDSLLTFGEKDKPRQFALNRFYHKQGLDQPVSDAAPIESRAPVACRFYQFDQYEAKLDSDYHSPDPQKRRSVFYGDLRHVFYGIFGHELWVDNDPNPFYRCTESQPSYEWVIEVAGGSKVSGWAWDQTQPYSSVNILFLEGGQEIGSVWANDFRQDLLDQGKGDGYHGFTFEIPIALRDGRFRQISIAIQTRGAPDVLTTRPITFASGQQLEAGMQSVECDNTTDRGRIDGWARDLSQPGVPVDLIISEGDCQLARLSSNIDCQFLRGGCSSEKGFVGPHGFIYYLPNELVDGKTHELQIRFASTGAPVPGSPFRVGCPDNSRARPDANPAYEGFLDPSTNCELIHGWAWDAERPNHPIDVNLYDGNTLIATLSANLFRQDVFDAGKGNGLHSFGHYLPASLADGNAHTIRARIAETGQELGWSPIILQCLSRPGNLVASAVSATQVNLSWAASAGAVHHYQVERAQNINGPFTVIASNVPSTSFADTSVSVNTSYLYRVRASDASNSSLSAYSNIDLATTIIFADDPLGAGVTAIKTAHLTDLRRAINAVRAAANLSAFNWSETPQPGGAIKASHLRELRTNLNQARGTLRFLPGPYADDPIVLGVRIKKAHIDELRQGVR
jgi:hypothetical protein